MNSNAPEAGTKGAQKKKSKAETANFNRPKSKFATADGRLAELLDNAASIVGRALYSRTLTSPDVHTVEEALRVLFLDAADRHRQRAGVLSLPDREAA